MTIINVPADWKRVSENYLQQFLKDCEDYTRTGYVGAVQYQFRRGHRAFAILRETEHGEEIYVNPKLVPFYM